MELNVEKIEGELKRIGKSKYWLAKELDVGLNVVLYWMKSGSLRGAEPIAELFNIDPKDLIK